MYRYADADGIAILREADGAIIPCDPRNSDYAALTAEGAAITPYRLYADRNQARDALAAAIRGECRRRILKIADEDRQRNLTARGVELTLAFAQGALSAAEAQELDGLKAIWGRIKALRAACREKETALQALSLEALEAYVLMEGWPE